MDPLSPILPATILGGLALLVKDKLPWWSVPVITFFLLLLVQLLVLFNVFTVPHIRGITILELQVPLYDYVKPMFLTALYFSALSLLFTLVALGIDKFLKKYVESDAVRYVVAIYITLLLLQLWVEVFPWTVTLVYRFYYSF